MAGSKSNYLENIILDLLLGVVPAGGWARPAGLANVYLALFTVTPGDANGGTEAAGSSYARKQLANDATNFGAAVNGVKTNVQDILFTTFTGNVGTIVAWGLYDQAAGGNLLFWGDLAVGDQKAYVANDQFMIPAGQMSITED